MPSAERPCRARAAETPRPAGLQGYVNASACLCTQLGDLEGIVRAGGRARPPLQRAPAVRLHTCHTAWMGACSAGTADQICSAQLRTPLSSTRRRSGLPPSTYPSNRPARGEWPAVSPSSASFRTTPLPEDLSPDSTSSLCVISQHRQAQARLLEFSLSQVFRSIPYLHQQMVELGPYPFELPGHVSAHAQADLVAHDPIGNDGRASQK